MKKGSTNIVLIGMPGAGKSTVGKRLAARTGRQFVDTDTLIETAIQGDLQGFVNREGYLALRATEEKVILAMHVQQHVIATGGSAVYSEAAMQQLQENGRIVFLHMPLAALEARIPDYSTRGLAKRPEQTFAELFAERQALYHRYAQITINADAGDAEAVCTAVIAALGEP